MSSIVELFDAIYRVRQGENQAAALEIIDCETGTVIKQADLRKIVYSIIRRGDQQTIQLTPAADVPVPGHIDREIPVAECIRDNPPVDPIDNVAYNFLFIIPTVDENDKDISPFTVSGAKYDMVIRFFPALGGRKYVANKTIRIECV
jgi:hypothetical protein